MVWRTPEATGVMGSCIERRLLFSWLRPTIRFVADKTRPGEIAMFRQPPSEANHDNTDSRGVRPQIPRCAEGSDPQGRPPSTGHDVHRRRDGSRGGLPGPGVLPLFL